MHWRCIWDAEWWSWIAVGAHLAAYKFTLKTKPTSPFDPRLQEALPEQLKLSPLSADKDWETGAVYARAQNLARTLMELPANMITPTVSIDRRIRVKGVLMVNCGILCRRSPNASRLSSLGSLTWRSSFAILVCLSVPMTDSSLTAHTIRMGR